MKKLQITFQETVDKKTMIDTLVASTHLPTTHLCSQEDAGRPIDKTVMEEVIADIF